MFIKLWSLSVWEKEAKLKIILSFCASSSVKSGGASPRAKEGLDYIDVVNRGHVSHNQISIQGPFDYEEMPFINIFTI